MVQREAVVMMAVSMVVAVAVGDRVALRVREVMVEVAARAEKEVMGEAKAVEEKGASRAPTPSVGLHSD